MTEKSQGTAEEQIRERIESVVNKLNRILPVDDSPMSEDGVYDPMRPSTNKGNREIISEVEAILSLIQKENMERAKKLREAIKGIGEGGTWPHVNGIMDIKKIIKDLEGESK